MLRKTLLHCLRHANRPVPVNFLRVTCCHFSTSRSNCTEESKSVLVDAEIKKLETPEKWRLDSVLSLQQTSTFDNIQRLKNAEELLHFLKNNKDIIAPLYAPLFLKIYDLVKSNKFDMSKNEFIRSREFENFCIKVKNSARVLRPNDNVNILKVLSLLGISMNSILCQNLLQVLSKNINELTLRELVFVSYLLQKAPSSPIMEAIKLSAPIVFDANVRTKLNHSDPKALVEAIGFAAGHKISDESIDIIVNSLNNIKDHLDLWQIYTVAVCMFKIRSLNNDRRTLIGFCLNKLNENMENLSINQINALTTRMVDNFLFVHTFYYDELFLSNVARYVIEKKLSLSEMGIIVRTFSRISYINIDLLNYIDKLLKDVSFNEFKVRITLFSFISLCSDARHKPLNWTAYENNVIKFLTNIEVIDVPLIRTVLELVTLQCWPIQLIEKVFQKDFLNKYLDRDKNIIDYLSIVNLYQAVLTVYPGEYKGPLPSGSIMDKARNLLKNYEKDTCIQPVVEMLFGGKKFVLSKVMTKLHHLIDHLIILRKDGKPYPLREDSQIVECLEDVTIPSNSFTFGIMVLNPSAFCIDGVRMRGKTKLLLDTLEALGVIPVPISMVTWDSLEDREKLPFVKREIFSRIPASDSAYMASDEILLND